MIRHGGKHGVRLQVEMFDRKVVPPEPDVDAMSARARAWFDQH
jgi:hypothetical protein